MPNLAVGFHSAAADEVAAAKEWYRERSEVAASAFIAELDRAMNLVAVSPERWSEHTHGTRQAVMRRFPFSIVCHVESSTVMIVAVAHARRLPGYWQNR